MPIGFKWTAILYIERLDIATINSKKNKDDKDLPK